MAKLEMPIRVYMGEIEEIINELKHLQTYKLFEGDDEVLINRDDVIKIFANHLRTETLSGSTIEPERKKEKWIPVTERLPEKTGSYLVTFQENENAISFGGDNPFIGVELFDGSEWHNCSWYDVLAWREKPEPWRGEEDG